jgi:hypothetical protein
VQQHGVLKDVLQLSMHATSNIKQTSICNNDALCTGTFDCKVSRSAFFGFWLTSSHRARMNIQLPWPQNLEPLTFAETFAET